MREVSQNNQKFKVLYFVLICNSLSMLPGDIKMHHAKAGCIFAFLNDVLKKLTL